MCSATRGSALAGRADARNLTAPGNPASRVRLIEGVRSLEYLAIVPILVFLMIAHEWGHFIVARRTGIVVEEFAIGFPPRLLSTVRDGVRYSINLIPFGAYVKMLGEEDPSEPGSFASQSKRVRSFVLAAGSGMNFLVAILSFSLAYATGWPDPRQADIEITGVATGSPAEQAGIRPGDVIVLANGREVRSLDGFREEVSRRAGQPLSLEVNRDGQRVPIEVVPRPNAPEGQGPLGVRLQGKALPVPHGPVESLAFGVQRSFEVVALTFIAPIMYLRGELAGELVRPIGLPGMTQVAAQAATAVVATGWWYPVLLITGAFSAGLAVANMLPLPALDGGRLLFVAIEAIRGRRVPPEREGLIHLVGMVLLLSLMVAISFNDLVVPPVSIDWGIR
jgi:regulator of sigma E protease